MLSQEVASYVNKLKRKQHLSLRPFILEGNWISTPKPRP
jgi:hypothetical protein